MKGVVGKLVFSRHFSLVIQYLPDNRTTMTKKCPHCDHEARDNHNLKLHLERNHECKLCGKKFETKENVKDHLKVRFIFKYSYITILIKISQVCFKGDHLKRYCEHCE